MASPRQEQKILRAIQYVSLVLTIVFAAGGYFLRSESFALSVLFGSVLVNGSFWLLKRDAEQILNRVAASQAEASQAVQRMERIRFIVKFYAKLIVLGLLLYAASTRMQLDMIGVALGLSTVMLSVIGIVLGGGRKLYSVQSV
jgi:hypothetical protein